MPSAWTFSRTHPSFRYWLTSLPEIASPLLISNVCLTWVMIWSTKNSPPCIPQSLTSVLLCSPPNKRAVRTYVVRISGSASEGQVFLVAIDRMEALACQGCYGGHLVGIFGGHALPMLKGLQLDDDLRPALVQYLLSVGPATGQTHSLAGQDGLSCRLLAWGRFWVGREISGTLKRILEGRLPRNSCRSAPDPALQFEITEIAGLVLRPALDLFGAHRKGHHQRFVRGAVSCAAGKAFVMVLTCSSSSW